jgi:serine/threonine protein kinase
MLFNNRYQKIQELGKGGFGDTFLVKDTQLPSGKYCVLKELTPIENNEEIYTLVKQRFEREAIVLEELGNINGQIPSLYAYFTENSKFYLVQEYIEGNTLFQHLNTYGVMDAASVQSFLVDVLQVLGCVHDRKIIHRDIKPDNIIIRQSDQKPVLIDFGAVRETMGTVINTQGNSSQSIVIGTPGFMPSEQAIGRPTFASDLYSLGLTAIYLLTGKMPQDLPTDSMSGEIQWKHLAPNIPRELSLVLDRAILISVKERFQTSREMLNQLLGGAGEVGTQVPVMRSTEVSGRSQHNKTVISHPPDPTIAAAPRVIQHPQHASVGQKTSTNGWLNSAIIGGAVGACILGGFFMNRPQQASQANNPPPVSPSPTATPSAASATPQVTAMPIPTATTVSTQMPAAPSPQRWQEMGKASTGEQVLLDSQSISRSNTGVQFSYKIGNDTIAGNADCAGNRWYVDGYGWNSPSSGATQNMLGVVCSGGTTSVPSATNVSATAQPNGWIRLGALNNSSGSASPGESLIATKQPVTIAPSVVPQVGDRITLTTSVNLRSGVPESPNYKLKPEVGEIRDGQTLTIHQVQSFVDASGSSPGKTTVWAAVALN